MSSPETSPYPWMPEKPFIYENRVAISDIVTRIISDSPTSGAEIAYNPEGLSPSPEAMQWMWTHFMGRQHGTLEGPDKKIVIPTNVMSDYMSSIQQLHYGPYYFTEAYPASPGKHYDTSLVLGGLTQEMARRLQAARGSDPREVHVSNLTLLAGQRLRWHQAPGERSLQDIYAHVAEHTGTNVDNLREKSSWLRAEEKKVSLEGNNWSGPFATETAIGRLCLEAYFFDLIDWSNGVETIEDPEPSEITYSHEGKQLIIPPRTSVLTRYHLRDNTTASILDAQAVSRAQGVPRPTSDSQTKEAVQLGIVGQIPNETINIAVSPPHFRAGLDVLTRILSMSPRKDRGEVEIVSHKWLPDKDPVTALGEIPATHKADLRLRAALNGQDPDSKELSSL